MEILDGKREGGMRNKKQWWKDKYDDQSTLVAHVEV